MPSELPRKDMYKVSKFYRKVYFSDTEACHTVWGRLFHTRGPATAKLLSPRVVGVRGTASVL